MASYEDESSVLWERTPLRYSESISARLHCSVYLKLENLQPTQSFKNRGVALFVQRAAALARTKTTHGEQHAPPHFVIASSGSAGLAAAYAARRLGAQCTVCLPEGTMSVVVARLKEETAEVVEEGKVYTDALERAKAIVAGDPHALMVPAYDDPAIWEGHGSMIEEIASAPEFANGEKPKAIFCCVGGGGLLGGLMEGCKKVGWDDIHIVALETHGASAFYQTAAANRGWTVHSDLHQSHSSFEDQATGVIIVNSRPVSRATSLGSTSPAPTVVKEALEWKGGVTSVTVPDGMSMQAAIDYADEHHMLIELASSTTLVPGFNPALFGKLVPEVGSRSKAVFIVCGGLKVSEDEVKSYRSVVKPNKSWVVVCDGKRWQVVGNEEILES